MNLPYLRQDVMRMRKLEEIKNKYLDKIHNQDTQRYIRSRRLIDFSAGIVVLMIGNLAAVHIFVAASNDEFLVISVATMMFLFGEVLWTHKKKKVCEYHYLLAMAVTYMYGLAMFRYCESGIITFGLIYPVLSIFILKQLWGNILIFLILITGFAAEKYYKPDDIWSNFNIVYLAVYLMFWAFSITMESVRIFMEKRIIQQKEQLEFFAHFDSLTKLYNRRRFYEVIKEKFPQERENASVSLVVLDIDNFKRINDTYGHNAGDEILVELAKRLRKGSREEDLVCRWGGEEFLILAETDSMQKGQEYAQRLCDQIAQSEFAIGGGEKLAVTASFGGIYIDSFRPDSIVDFVHAADENLYLAKKNGKNRVCF